jgi:O-acetyl-ADP-ribose deacetylase (regulator of RNase III)
MEFGFKGKTLEVLEGDITQVKADAVVNAANECLRGGGGVDGAIHRAGGPAIMEECRRIGRCPTGTAVITTGGNLPARYVIHTVGPVWHGGDRSEAELLRSAYDSSLELASDRGLSSIAFPSISTGVYGFPIDQAAPIAIRAALDHLAASTTLDRLSFVLFSKPDFELYVNRMKTELEERSDAPPA